MALCASLVGGARNPVCPLRLREENRSTSAVAYARLAVSFGTEVRQSFFLSGAAGVGNEIHALEICLGCPTCPT